MGGSLGEASQEKVEVPVGGQRRLTKGQAMYIDALDPQTRERAARGQTFNFRDARAEEPFTLGNATRQAVFDALSPDELAAVSELKSLYDRMFFRPLDRVSLRLNGHRLEKVPGYWGVQRNMLQSEKVGQAQGWRGIMAAHLENTPMLKEREGGKTPIMIGDFAQDLMTRARSAAKVISTAEAVRTAEMTLLHPEVVRELSKRMGRVAVDRVRALIGDAGGGAIDPKSEWLKPLRWVNSNVAASMTQVNPRTWARNLGGLGPMAYELERTIGAKYLAAGAKGLTDMSVSDLSDRSPIFWERYSRGVQHVFDAVHGAREGGEIGQGRAAAATLRQLGDAAKKAGNMKWGEALRSVKESDKAFAQLKDAWDWGNWFDSAAARVAYRSFEAYAKEKKPQWTEAQRERWVIQKTEQAFERTQNTNDLWNSSEWARRGRQNPLWGMHLTFTSDSSKARNLLYQAYRRGPRDFGKALAAITAGKAWSGAVTWGSRAALTGAAALLGIKYTKDDKGEKALAVFGKQFLREMVSTVPLGGNALDFAKYLATGSGADAVLDTPASTVATKVFEGSRYLLGAEEDWRTDRRRQTRAQLTAAQKFLRGLDRAAEAAGNVLGLPVPMAHDAYRVLGGD